jgi:uncharacterized membrane protein YgcG
MTPFYFNIVAAVLIFGSILLVFFMVREPKTHKKQMASYRASVATQNGTRTPKSAHPKTENNSYSDIHNPMNPLNAAFYSTMDGPSDTPTHSNKTAPNVDVDNSPSVCDTSSKYDSGSYGGSSSYSGGSSSYDGGSSGGYDGGSSSGGCD